MIHKEGNRYALDGLTGRVFVLLQVSINIFVLEEENKAGQYASEPVPLERGAYSRSIVITDDILYRIAGNKGFKAIETTFNILEQANNLIHGDRAASYGTADSSFRRIATGWSAILGTTVTPEQVGLCMAWLKIARQVGKPNRDNLVDAAGYIGCVEKVQKGE